MSDKPRTKAKPSSPSSRATASLAGPKSEKPRPPARAARADVRKPAREGKSEHKHDPKNDIVLIQGISEDGEALAVLRAREDRLEAGIVRSVKQGEVGKGELVRLKPRPESPLICDVEVELPDNALNARGGSDRAAPHHGPAQVATASYRANWDAIWKKPGGKKSLPN